MSVGVYDAHSPRMPFGGSGVLPDLHGRLVCFTQSYKGSCLLRKPDDWLKQKVRQNVKQALLLPQFHPDAKGCQASPTPEQRPGRSFEGWPQTDSAALAHCPPAACDTSEEKYFGVWGGGGQAVPYHLQEGGFPLTLNQVKGTSRDLFGSLAQA